ncbi:hypothetical protein KAR91_37375 [Candidatus Pacearchaeota archaeon]|nr:hypothetical protein [Candidatus Pacearchaeota archaeon]
MKSFSIMCSKIGALFVLCLVLAVFLYAPTSGVVVAESDHEIAGISVASVGDAIPLPAVVPVVQNEDRGANTAYILISHSLMDTGIGKTIVSAKETTLAPIILMKTAKTGTGLIDESGGAITSRLSQGDHPVGIAYEDSGGSAGEFLYSDVTRKVAYTSYAPRQSI